MNFKVNYNLTGIFLIGILLRIYYLVTVDIVPVDALQFIEVADSIKQGESYPNAREIGYPLLLVFIFIFSEISFHKLRILTIVIGSINILLFYRFSKKMLTVWMIEKNSERISLFASFLLATSNFAIQFDNSGVREPIVLFLFLWLFPLIYSEQIDKRHFVYIFVIYFSIAIIRSEFQFLSAFLMIIFFFESKQHGNYQLRIKGFVILSAGITAMIVWSILSSVLLGDASASSKMLISQTIARNSPNTTAGGLSWYIFEYHGVFRFFYIELFGAANIVLRLNNFLGVIGYSLFILGLVIIINKNYFTLILIFLSGAILNGFNAYEWEYIGADRILLPYYALLYIISALPIGFLENFNFKISSDKYLTISYKYIILTIGIINILVSLFEL